MVETVGSKKDGMRRAIFGIDDVVGIKRVKGIRKKALKHDSKNRISVCFRTRTFSSEFLIAFGAIFPGSKVSFYYFYCSSLCLWRSSSLDCSEVSKRVQGTGKDAQRYCTNVDL